MAHKREKTISPAAAVRAIYFDFEGFVSRPPALTGVLCEHEFEQMVHDKGPRHNRGLESRPP